MYKPLKILSFATLAGVIVPPLLYFAGVMGSEPVKWIALASTVCWFATTPLWMGRELPPDATEVEI
jgi:hypothetical protein